MRYGLIGNPLGHSWSPKIHALLGDYDYKLYPMEEDAVAGFLAQDDIGGLNVTIPYKKTVIPYCKRLSMEAAAIGAVNTLCFREDGIYGHNTDCEGFTYMARRAGIDFHNKKVVILGSGGTSLTARYCAQKLGARQIVIVSRKGEDNYDNIARHFDAEIIVNTTPVGMYPNVGKTMLDLDDFDNLCGVLDVVYNPMRTRLVQDAIDREIPASGGLSMLVAQAVGASAAFFEKEIPDEVIEGVYRAIASDVENVVICGMPGCGKSSVGQAVAKLLGRDFIDLDEKIAEAAGMSVPALISTYGEEYFRGLETEQAQLWGMKSGLVIACGGGTPLRKANVDALKGNGRMYRLTRDLRLLPTDGRPLSKNMEELERIRRPFYEAAADVTIDNSTTIEDAAKRIVEAHRA